MEPESEPQADSPSARVSPLLTPFAIRAAMLAVGLLAGLVVVLAWAIDEGEVVKIVTHDAEGNEYETELWIVDEPEGTFLRAVGPAAEWLDRLRERGVLQLERGDEEMSCRAEPRDTAQLAAEIDRAMAKKYGFTDRLWGAVADRSATVPILLSGCTHVATVVH